MANIYFVTEARIKDYTTVLGNVDAKLLSPLIPTLAGMWIEPRLGSYFYAHLLSVYNAETANSYETELISLIQQSLIWRAAADYTISSSGQLSNKGPQDQNGINSSSSDLSKIGMLKKHYEQKAVFYDSRIESYIRLNKDNLPEFTADANNNSSIVDLTPEKGKGGSNYISFL